MARRREPALAHVERAQARSSLVQGVRGGFAFASACIVARNFWLDHTVCGWLSSRLPNRRPGRSADGPTGECECGYVAHADTDDDVLADIRNHMRSDHPGLLEQISDQQVLDWMEVIA
jgi:predicted small metal-binding protein